MTTLQILVMTCAYAIALAAVIYFTRATSRRVAGALAGGAAAGCWGLGAIIVGEAIGVWRDFLPSAHGAWVLFYLGLAISLSPIYLITWRAARRFGWRGLAVCLIVAGSRWPASRLSVRCDVPGVGSVRAGRAPVLADAATYVGIVALGHAVMRLVSGPALGSPLARQPSSLGALWRGHVFLFDKKREPATFGDAAGARLLLIVAGLEIIRLSAIS